MALQRWNGAPDAGQWMHQTNLQVPVPAGIEKLAELEGPDAFAWTLRKASLEFLRPARLNDLIEVHTKAAALTGARMTAEQDIFCNGHQLTRGMVEACIITLMGKPRRIPQDTRDKLSPFLLETGA